MHGRNPPLKFLPFGLQFVKYDRFKVGDVGESPLPERYLKS